LSYLKRFPVNKIKIDKSFVRDINVDEDDKAIVQAIIAMAQQLKLRVVAEGVETREQLSFLQTHNCDEIQGFYFSPPINTSELEQMLTHQQQNGYLMRSPQEAIKSVLHKRLDDN
jgi:EAL domain-containing protein (putative c-di-GMP-specific phosphodiesterase class I)